jgi:hypothetical protein
MMYLYEHALSQTVPPLALVKFKWLHQESAVTSTLYIAWSQHSLLLGKP